MAIVASHRVRSRLSPSRAANPVTEMRLINDNFFDEHGTPEKVNKLPNLIAIVARSIYNITNQLLRAKMDGHRPLLVSMGTNALSGS
jgi:hypothetical protein